MENLLSYFQDTLKKLQVAKNARLLLAVSGGLDSVVLSHLSFLSGLDFSIAHVNFQLRGPESDRDERFVQQMAGRYQKPFLLEKFETAAYAQKEKQSIQLAARNLRYTWFKSLLGSAPEDYQFLLTAHHLDDNIETMLMHFFRGTGIQGLAGIPEKNERLIRPLLSVSKNILKDFATAHGLEWVEDSSNDLDEYTRNFFRNQLIPSLRGFFPEINLHLEKNLQRFSETAVLYHQVIDQYKKKLLKTVGKETHIPILLLQKATPLRTICFEIFKEYHFSAAQTDELIRLLRSSNGKYIASPSHRVIKNRRWLIIAPLENTEASHVVVDQNQDHFSYPEGKLLLKISLRQSMENIPPVTGTALLDAEKIQFPLLLRKWKTGDYFYPLGMTKKKKLARFFIDQKLSKTAKEKVWVLVMDSQILWVVGHRIDNRFSIQPSTKKILTIKNADV
jgi:tRNA(Ile)-lysidine synthase